MAAKFWKPAFTSDTPVHENATHVKLSNRRINTDPRQLRSAPALRAGYPGR